MKLFIAGFPPKDYLDYFRDVIRTFSKQKRNLIPVPLEQIHVTIKYIGAEVSINSKDLIIEEFMRHQGNFERPLIELTSLQFGFPFQSYKTVMHCEVNENESLKKLIDQTHGIIRKLDLPDTIRWKGKYKSHSHITFARLKENANRSISKLINSNVKNVRIPLPAPFKLNQIAFVESRFIDNKPKYTVLERINL